MERFMIKLQAFTTHTTEYPIFNQDAVSGIGKLNSVGLKIECYLLNTYKENEIAKIRHLLESGCFDIELKEEGK